jgi:hypothetical protein
MIRRRLLLALPLAAAAWPLGARADDAVAHKQVGQYVDLLPVALPIVADGQLMNYVFVNVRLNLTTGTDTSRWRAKEPFFRDALVRAAHETPFVLAGDYDHIDAAKLTATMTRAAQAITGPGVIRSVEVLKQAPSRRPRVPHA